MWVDTNLSKSQIRTLAFYLEDQKISQEDKTR